ncbi:DUF1569 domain-containing protein [Arenibacter aquaticus]|uniref:DUF1569 domain-containing protein n=1 Tax=Arenibacter aquaticus TaxID=2489054 RepID=A0A3S0AGR7_9FLAO|nr:DUF1569 domain-containing protein [Arenibacter aquaticus]RTE55456.1 DUF1569 domain-containing protein [Arenibacter aquaticus]
MKTIFDKTTRNGLIARIELLHENSAANWGKMNVSQMLKHCTLYDEWLLGKNNPIYKQAFIGKIFGKMALKSMIKDERPLKQNMGTLDELKVTESNGNVSVQKEKWIDLIREFEHFSNPDFIHTFFGKMTKEQIGYLDYKHTDHHLRQFGV